MNNGNESRQPIPLITISKLTFLLGAGCGVILIPFMAIEYMRELNIWFLFMIILFTPIVNGVVMVFYALLGYWLYKIVHKKGWITL